MFPKTPVSCGGAVAAVTDGNSKGAGGAEGLQNLIQALGLYGVGIDLPISRNRWGSCAKFQGYATGTKNYGNQFIVGQTFVADNELAYSGLNLQGGALSFQMESSQAAAYDGHQITFLLHYLQDIIIGAQETTVIY